MRLLLIDNVANQIVCYWKRTAIERFAITDRKEFDANFTRDTAERLRAGPVGKDERHGEEITT